MLKAATMIMPLANEINTRRLMKQVVMFYKKAVFMPAPHIINLYDRNCVQRIADDLALLSKDTMLYDKIIKLLEVI
jgi:hypothetical protein